MRPVKYIFAGIVALCGLAALAQQVNPLAPQPQRERTEAPVATPAPAETGTPQLTAQDVNAWLDGFMPYALGEGDIAGA
jgi:hypothetical protein